MDKRYTTPKHEIARKNTLFQNRLVDDNSIDRSLAVSQHRRRIHPSSSRSTSTRRNPNTKLPRPISPTSLHPGSSTRRLTSYPAQRLTHFSSFSKNALSFLISSSLTATLAPTVAQVSPFSTSIHLLQLRFCAPWILP